MAKRAKFEVTHSVRKDRWMVNVPGSVTASGRRERHYFETKKEALAKASDMRKAYHEYGSQASAITPSLAEAAVQAAEKLKPFGVTLTAAIADYLAILETRERSVTLAEAASRWLASKGDCRDETQKSYRYTVKRLQPLEDQIMAEITADDIEAAIESSPSVFEGHRRNARALFEFAARKGWCESGVTRTIAKRKYQSGEITTLTPMQVRELLSSAEANYPETVAGFAVALFAGIRLGELERLKWENVYDDGIEVSSANAKKRRRRFVPMNPTLKAWLAGRRAENPGCLIIPANWTEKSKGVRRIAGFDVVARILKEPTKLPKGAPKWPQNAMRHTHASAAVANGITLDELIFSFGHTGTPEMLKSHYVGLYRPNDAVAFWGIGPRGTKIQTIRAA